MTSRGVAIVVGSCAVLSALAHTPAAAQHVVEGVVVTASDGMPVRDATVTVVGEDLVVGTDSTGHFRFELPEARPGVALEIGLIGFSTYRRTWILPLERPIRIGLEREAVELPGIDVAVDRPSGWSARPLDYKLKFRVRSLMAIDRTANAADLRAYPHQEAEIWDFLSHMNVFGMLDGGFIASGRVSNPSYIMDDRGVVFDEFRSYPVGDICRLDVVTIPGRGLEKSGIVMAYSCEFLLEVAKGERTLSPFLPLGVAGN